jgi:hypothetical protein
MKDRKVRVQSSLFFHLGVFWIAGVFWKERKAQLTFSDNLIATLPGVGQASSALAAAE